MRKLSVSFFFVMLFLFTCGVQDGFARKKKKGVKEVEKETPYQKLFKGKICETVKGLLTIHKMDGKVYFEIPRNLLEKDMLLGSTISETTNNLFGSVGEKPTDPLCVQFTQTDTIISLRQVNHGYTTELANVAQRIRESMKPAVMYNSGILAYNPDSTAVVVEMTEFFLRDDEQLTPFSAYAPATWGGRWIVKEFKKDNSQLGRIKAFEDNVSVQSSLSYEVNLRNQRYYYIYKLPFTSLMTRSFILLPEEPMRPRMADPRIGIFYQGVSDFRNGDSGLKNIYYAQRWRLEPSDETAFRMGRLVEPKKPIIIYIDPATPKKWVPYLIQGVNDWQAAFEKAGFKNAIFGKEAPTDDPTWSLEDARHSAIVYKPSDIPNASGPHVHDPRSGEILETHINWYHNVMSLLYNWYIVQAGAIDPGARKPMFDDELMGELIRFVSSHEVGHTLGLRHNFGSSNTVPVEKLRDKIWVEANGHTPSIMDYARFNYVAQPEDNISRSGIFPRIGMYDKWAIEWGYRWMPEYETAEAEIPHLNKWIIEKLREDKRYTFGTELDRNDPRNQSEDLGDDAMLASSYGIKNLKRVMPEIMNWTYEPNEGYMKAVRLYQNVVGQFDLYMGHVATNVAGIYHNPISVEQTDMKAVEYVPKDFQKKAVDFLNKELFTTPTWLMDDKLSERTGINTFNSIYRVQSSTLKQLLSSRTLDKMTDNELVNGAKAYTANDLFRDLKKSIWSDLQGGKKPDASQRSLQKTYVNALIGMLDKPKNSSGSLGSLGGYSLVAFDFPSEAPTIARGQLTDLKRDLTNAANASSGIYRSHYLNLKALIDAAFDVK